MPVSIFLGRPTPHPGEPLWLPEDTGWALALAAEEADTCPKCGLPLSVCADEAYEMAFKGEQARICWPTWAIAQAQDAMGPSSPANREATLWRARLRDGFTPPLRHDDGGGDR